MPVECTYFPGLALREKWWTEKLLKEDAYTLQCSYIWYDLRKSLSMIRYVTKIVTMSDTSKICYGKILCPHNPLLKATDSIRKIAAENHTV